MLSNWKEIRLPAQQKQKTIKKRGIKNPLKVKLSLSDPIIQASKMERLSKEAVAAPVLTQAAEPSGCTE